VTDPGRHDQDLEARRRVVGDKYVERALSNTTDYDAIRSAHAGQREWADTPITEPAAILRHAAGLGLRTDGLGGHNAAIVFDRPDVRLAAIHAASGATLSTVRSARLLGGPSSRPRSPIDSSKPLSSVCRS
jgi:acyl-CoA reductase-like NAD-dependent aldehyde dehydrogenase